MQHPKKARLSWILMLECRGNCFNPKEGCQLACDGIRLRNGWPPHFDHEKLDRMRNLPDASENPRRKKRGFWGESRLAFESIVEEVRRFVARMPPADYSAGSACYLRNFSALGD
jgi:hypothetical protein